MKADQPRTAHYEQYHTHTSDGDLSYFCLIVGASGRADMIAEKFLTKSKRFSNDHRGLVSHTGYYGNTRVSVTTSGMGGASTGIVLPEAVRSGARLFIRVGSCGSLIEESHIGDVIIPTCAIRYDGASNNWAPPEFPAVADWRVVSALTAAAEKECPSDFHLGPECTTDCFYDGQGRPDIWGTLSERMLKRHQEVMDLGAACYSMEAASLFVWCMAKGRGLPCGAINAVFANRHSNEWGVEGEERAAKIALDALVILSSDPSILADISRHPLPAYS
ncbi:MAG: nucleoside phosphorylase [Candidatus Doudnabacteria bacterium]|nr:nucleoside phosphorylase [Candidatus Doudnabacteria bacterium]